MASMPTAADPGGGPCVPSAVDEAVTAGRAAEQEGADPLGVAAGRGQARPAAHALTNLGGEVSFTPGHRPLDNAAVQSILCAK